MGVCLSLPGLRLRLARLCDVLLFNFYRVLAFPSGSFSPAPLHAPQDLTLQTNLDKTQCCTMQRSSVINLSHSYDLPNVDAVFNLVPVDGTARRLKVWRAHGARDRLRVAEHFQRPGEPEFQAGDVRYLCINRDVVIPIYAITEYHTNEWNVEVRYDEGGEPDIYQFQDKQEALGFQSLVTGYDVHCCFENVGIYLTHRRHKLVIVNALRLRGHPELAASGEVQLWQRRSLTRSARVGSPVQSGRPVSQTTISGQASRHLSDNLSLFADSSTGQQFYLSDHVPSPLLVLFAKEPNGNYTMLKMNIPKLQTKVFGNSIVLRPSAKAGDRDFMVKQLTVKGSGLAQWNVCALGAFVKAPGLETLVSTSLTLETRPGEAEAIDEEILLLQRDYIMVQLQGDRAKAATINNEEIPSPGGGRGRKTSGSTGSSSSSATVNLLQVPRNHDATTGYNRHSRRSFLPSLRSHESLNGMFTRELGRGPAQLDSESVRVNAAAELESSQGTTTPARSGAS